MCYFRMKITIFPGNQLKINHKAHTIKSFGILSEVTFTWAKPIRG